MKTKPYYDEDGITIFHGDCRSVFSELGLVDAVVADPPYGATSLAWDSPVVGWVELSRAHLSPSGSLWCFGSIKMLLARADEFFGWKVAQDLVWEKQNGSSMQADRFRRVHEHVVQFYPADARWSDVYKSPVYTTDETARTVRRKTRPTHWGDIGAGHYASEDGGPRLARSVQRIRSCHGHAEHPTQKPVELLKLLIEYSVPPGGVVLDPFVGSGSTLCAAKELGRRAIGVEVEEKFCAVAARRLVAISTSSAQVV